MKYFCKGHYFCQSVPQLGMQMQEGFANEGRRKQEDNINLQEDNIKLKEEMIVRKNEAFKNEERTRKLVQND